MNDDNSSSDPPGSPNELTISTGPAAEEISNAINAQDVINLIVDDPSTSTPTTSTVNDGPPIAEGNAQPIEEVNQSTIVITDQPVELIARRQQAADDLLNLPSPSDLNIVDDYHTQFSGEVQNIRVHVYITDDDIQLIERTSVGETEVDDLHNAQRETTAIEPVESPIRREHINEQMDNRPGEHIDVIDLTHDDDQASEHPEILEIHSNGATSPVTIDLTTEDDKEVEVIDLTGDNDEQEGPIQMASSADDNEQVHQSETDPPVTSNTEQVAPASSEATDQNVNFAGATDPHRPPIETTAQLQVPIPRSRKKKRSNSSDEMRRSGGQCIACEVKRGRYTIV